MAYPLNSDRYSDLFAAAAKIFDDLFDTQLVYGAHTLGGYTQFDVALLAIKPETMEMQIRQKTAPIPVVGVGNVVSRHWALACYLADLGHNRKPFEI